MIAENRWYTLSDKRPPWCFYDNSKMTATHSSPFTSERSAAHLYDDTDLHDQDPVQEDVSDGLQIFRKASSWLLPTYTRKDCRCGQCSLGDPEPCPYAKPNSSNSLTSVLSTGRRSLSRLLSARDQTGKDNKHT